MDGPKRQIGYYMGNAVENMVSYLNFLLHPRNVMLKKKKMLILSFVCFRMCVLTRKNSHPHFIKALVMDYGGPSLL